MVRLVWRLAPAITRASGRLPSTLQWSSAALCQVLAAPTKSASRGLLCDTRSSRQRGTRHCCGRTGAGVLLFWESGCNRNFHGVGRNVWIVVPCIAFIAFAVPSAKPFFCDSRSASILQDDSHDMNLYVSRVQRNTRRTFETPVMEPYLGSLGPLRNTGVTIRYPAH